MVIIKEGKRIESYNLSTPRDSEGDTGAITDRLERKRAKTCLVYQEVLHLYRSSVCSMYSIGTYTKLVNRNLRYAVADAKAIGERLGDPRRGNFEVTILTEPAQTTETPSKLLLKQNQCSKS